MEKAPLYSEIADAPEGGIAYFLNTDDRVRIRVGLWQPKENSKGTILFFTARSEYIEKYGRTIKNFLDLGYAALVVDWRGQGLSDRIAVDPRIGHVNKYSDYQLDVRAMLNAACKLELKKPWYLIGSSMGACIGLRSLANGLPVDASAFSAPMWELNLSPLENIVAWPISWAIDALGKGEIYTPGRKEKSYVLSVPFQENSLTNDPDMYEYYIRQAVSVPEIQIASPSMGWLYQSLKECRDLGKISSPDTPCVAFWGDNDSVVSSRIIKDRMDTWRGGSFKLIENGKHDLLCDTFEVRNSVTNCIHDLFSSTAQNSTNCP